MDLDEILGPNGPKPHGLAGVELQQSTQASPSSNQLARQQYQKLLVSSLMKAFLLVWSNGDRNGERQVGREC
jgi:hypothetical protein